MAYFAKIENGVVVQVIVVHDSDTPNEAAGLAFLETLYGPGMEWVQTDVTGGKRKNYAGIGYTIDKTRDAFIAPKPYPSWTLDETTARYNAPVARPVDGKEYDWDEGTVSWKTKAVAIL